MVDNCRHVNKITPSPTHSILNPQKWLCCECGTTESVWACLSCSHVACGRYIEEHALKHYNETKHPLSLEVNEKYAYCYECSDYILNDNPAGDLKILRNALSAVALQSFEGLEKRGRRILRSQSYSSLDKGFERRLREQDRNHTILWFRRYYVMAKAFSAWKQGTPAIQKQHEEQVKKKQEPENTKPQHKSSRKNSESQANTSISKLPGAKNTSRRKGPFIPGVTGLRNLGNTCYMNSVLQVLRHLLSCSHLREFRQFYIQTCENELDGAGSSPQQSTSLSTISSNSGHASASGSYTNGVLKRTESRRSPRQHYFARQTTMECFQHVTESGKKRVGLNGGSSESPSKKMKLSGAGKDNVDKNTVSLCGELHALLRVMWSGKWTLVSPDKMLSAVWQTIPFFKGYTQQDAQEFLCEFLDKLSSELEKNISLMKTSPSSSLQQNKSNKPVPSLLSSTTSPTSQLRRSISEAKTIVPVITADRVSDQMKDIVTNMFHGELVSEVTCQKCGKKSLTKEPFTDLSLEFPDRYHYKGGQKISYENCPLEEMLATFTEKETLEGNIYACEQCNKHRRRSVSAKPTVYTQVSKQFMVQTLPHVLRLHLKRFMWSGRNHRGKIAIHVDFGTELDMKPYCHPNTQAPSFMYELNAIVMHHGRGFGSGHYTAYCMNEAAESWIHCNDAKLEKISVEEVMKAQAYILFYTQKLTPIKQELSPKQLPLFDEEADEDITFNYHNSTIPRFVELKRRLSEDHSGRMALKKRKSNIW